MKICSKMRRLGAILTVVVMRWQNSQRRNKATNRTTFVVFGRKKEKNTNKTFLIARMRPASQIAYSTQDNQQCLTVKAPNFSLDWRKGAGSGSLGMLRAFFLFCFVFIAFILGRGGKVTLNDEILAVYTLVSQQELSSLIPGTITFIAQVLSPCRRVNKSHYTDNSILTDFC